MEFVSTKTSTGHTHTPFYCQPSLFSGRKGFGVSLQERACQYSVGASVGVFRGWSVRFWFGSGLVRSVSSVRLSVFLPAAWAEATAGSRCTSQIPCSCYCPCEPSNSDNDVPDDHGPLYVYANCLPVQCRLRMPCSGRTFLLQGEKLPVFARYKGQVLCVFLIGSFVDFCPLFFLKFHLS